MNSKKIGIAVILLLLIGLAVAVFLSLKQSNIKQEASGSVNINKASTITTTINADGTMGPQTSANNYSNQQASDKTGSLIVLITDPSSDSKPAFPTGLPTVAQSNNVSSVPAKTFSNGFQNVKSLIVKIKKGEVHLVSPDRWETLKMDVPISLDLVQLQNGIVASLGSTKLLSGNYSEIRLYIENSTATLQDDSIKNLDMTGKDWIVKVDNEFSITPKKNTTVVLDFDAQKSVDYQEGKFNLKPFVAKTLNTK